MAVDRPGEDSRVVPVALEHVDLRRSDSRRADVGSRSRPGVRHQPENGPGTVPLRPLHPCLEVPVPEDLPRGERRRGDVAWIALGPARDEVEDPVSHVLASRRRRGVPPLVVVPHATPKPGERVHEDHTVAATGDRRRRLRGRPRAPNDGSRGKSRRALGRRALGPLAEHARIDLALWRGADRAHGCGAQRRGADDSGGSARARHSEKRNADQTGCNEKATQQAGQSSQGSDGTLPGLRNSSLSACSPPSKSCMLAAKSCKRRAKAVRAG